MNDHEDVMLLLVDWKLASNEMTEARAAHESRDDSRHVSWMHGYQRAIETAGEYHCPVPPALPVASREHAEWCRLLDILDAVVLGLAEGGSR